ncbi:hypothetical protein BH09MYX1_BH09MYX1_54660 [soil metagenome]
MAEKLFKDRNLGIEANLGRPRTVLAIGARLAETASAAKDRGAHVTAIESDILSIAQVRDIADESYALDRNDAFAPVRGRTFDLVLIEDVDADALKTLLERTPDFLTDGGHVLLAVRSGKGTTSRVEAALESVGLELMRVDFDPRILKTLATLTESADDLQTLHTTSLRFTQQLVWPFERLIAKAFPAALADEVIFIARKAPKKGPLSLTVGMLTLNETESVEKMIDDIRAVAPDAKILLIDSSSDQTPELARAKGARVIRQLPPRGHGPAMERLMYEAALESDALIYIDCDFTYPTYEIPNMRKMLEDGADVVNGSRTSTKPKAMPVPNFIANRTFAASAQLVHGIPTTDVHSGMRAYRSSVIRAFSFDGEGDALPLDTLILPARSNYNVIEFPIEYSERLGFSKLAKLRGTVWSFIRIGTAIGKGDRVRRGRRYVVGRS